MNIAAIAAFVVWGIGALTLGTIPPKFIPRSIFALCLMFAGYWLYCNQWTVERWFGR